MAHGGPPREVNLEDPKAVAESRLHRLDRGRLHGATRGTAGGGKDDERRPSIRNFAQRRPEACALFGAQAFDAVPGPEANRHDREEDEGGYDGKDRRPLDHDLRPAA